MPKGYVEPREVTCRACGQPFTTDRCGKAAFYCDRTACRERRKRERLVIPNGDDTLRVEREVAEKRARAEQRQAERQATAERRRLEKAAERDRRAAERKAQQARERNAKRQAKRREQRAVQAQRAVAAEAARQDRERQHRVTVAQKAAERLVPRLVKAREHVAELVGEMRDHVATIREHGGELPDDVAALAQQQQPVRSATPPAPSDPTPARDDTAPAAPPPTGDAAARLAQLHRDVASAHLARAEQGNREPVPHRQHLARCIRRVGTAAGAVGTADALYALAVAALAWESHLRRSAREVRQEAGEA